MKSAFHGTAEELLPRLTALLSRHPRRILAGIATLLLSATGLSYAIVNLAPDAAQLPVQKVTEALETPSLSVQVYALESQAQSLNLFRSDQTRPTDTAETLLKRLGIFDPQAAAFLRSDAFVQKHVLARPGRSVTAESSAGNALLKMQVRWSPDEDGSFKRLSIEKSAKGFVSRLETLPLTARARMASGTITTSLFAATDAAQIPDAVSTQLADIFSGEIDFHRALKPGDRFSVVYQALEGDGEALRTGRILSAEFVNNGKSHQAVWFQDPAPVQGSVTTLNTPEKGGYYSPSGQSLKRAFLAAPLAFSRITSSFKMRFHPILQEWKAHLGVDYAAPVGTAVRSVGDGVVEFAGTQNGYGNVVKVRHANQITTVYAHLSHINAHVGQPLAQGQLLGAVGTSGWATGPHLHFEYRVSGAYQDPQTVARRNDTVPLAAGAKPVFDRVAAQARVDLLAANQMQFSSVE